MPKTSESLQRVKLIKIALSWLQNHIIGIHVKKSSTKLLKSPQFCVKFRYFVSLVVSLEKCFEKTYIY